MQIGVDVGGTNTDGVIMSDGKVLISDKKVTTSNVGDGVFNVIKSVLEKGKIIESGTYEGLNRSDNSRFRRMVEIQSL